MRSDTTESGLERLICTALTGHPCDPRAVPSVLIADPSAAAYGAGGWMAGAPEEYDREYCVDRAQLREFLRATRPKVAEALGLEQDSPTRRKFLARMQGEVTKRGTIDLLRLGFKREQHMAWCFAI